MNGQQLLDLLSNILGDESPNPVFMLQLLNLARIRIEGLRPWKVLVTTDKTQTVSPATTYTTPVPLPSILGGSPADFVRFLGESTLAEGSVILFDGNTDVEYITEIPIENILFNKDQYGNVAVDYGNNNLYFTGLIPKTYTVYQYYIGDYGDITLNTVWQKFPKRFAPILAFDAAAHWRLGTDYDDVNARNADDNYKMYEQILETMRLWDSELAISATNRVNYPDLISGNNSGGNYAGYGPRGVRANF